MDIRNKMHFQFALRNGSLVLIQSEIKDIYELSASFITYFIYV